MKQPILYSFVRFKPYFETGEFVNVGLLMCEPEKRQLTYRLVAKNDKRVNDFFYRSKIFASVRDTINEELHYITEQAFDFTPQEMARFFHHYTDVKEGIIQYSNAAVGLVENPQDYFNDLYTRYIHLCGVKSDNQESIMVQRFKALFRAENDEILQSYKEYTVAGELTKFKLPLALKNEGEKEILKAVKPLAFDQIESPSMIEHCDNWVSKINRADEEGLLKKENILFTLDTADTANKINVLNVIKRTFDRFNIRHIDWNNNSDLIAFAKNV
ncbi:DUF3037 domain-containing protein [Avibacterium paragallinarum]|uniref:DUF3037 domain-containing protein n=1 Tax=Avibacterium paragallinarum TaxID=728 RepID=A0A377I9C9_AVIPA|nr:DUF3037 domain-containing protein [Avibacterium paragallinarum]POY47446.1 DUF3037 domain-containing protein [Avibacterium paragallinarum]RZN54165.1 DUF3037 domain-containing protein [Avibacterium paragallinarum]RZN75241.1 DUF3037 domain-containing protein [Avibacterium paragallinarum]STO71329.1 Protein of uncharacterised function (DUF3037) [Avibacterium paragallinarum]